MSKEVKGCTKVLFSLSHTKQVLYCENKQCFEMNSSTIFFRQFFTPRVYIYYLTAETS